MKITGEEAFSVPEKSFCIGSSDGGYTLAYSADGITFTEYDTPTEAGVNAVVNFGAKHMIYKLIGNTGEVNIQY